jgi:L-alanine-DL-glutamate epimerase-like enolase superfamily enzyme
MDIGGAFATLGDAVQIINGKPRQRSRGKIDYQAAEAGDANFLNDLLELAAAAIDVDCLVADSGQRVGGRLNVPTAPGLGVEADMAKVRKYAPI